MDTVYTKREDAGKALLGLLGMAMNRTEPVSIGQYKGFDLQIAYFAMDKMYLAYLVGSGINPVQLGADAVGNTVRLDNCLHNLPQSVTDLESKLVQLQKQLENAKEQLAQEILRCGDRVRAAEVQNFKGRFLDLERHVKGAVHLCDGIVGIGARLTDDKDGMQVIQSNCLPIGGTAQISCD